MVNIVLLLNLILFASEESFIAGFAATFRLIMIVAGLKLMGVRLFDFLVELLENIVLFFIGFFVVFDEFDDHVYLLVLNFRLGKIDSGIEPDLIFLFVSFGLVKSRVVAGPIRSM